MYIPDLFSAAIKGREAAIQANWQDLKNYEAIEAARNANDLQALQILRERAKFGGEMSMFQNQVDSSNLNMDIQNTAHPGMMARADMGTQAALAQRQAFLENYNAYQNMLGTVFPAQLQQAMIAAQVLQGKNDYLGENGRAGQMGRNSGLVSFNTSEANAITASNYPNAARQAINQGNANYQLGMAQTGLALDQVGNAKDLLPQQHTLAKTNLNNAIYDGSQYQANKANLDKQMVNAQLAGIRNQITALALELSSTTDPTSRAILANQIKQLQALLPVGEQATINQQATEKPLVPTVEQQALNGVNNAANVGTALTMSQQAQNLLSKFPVVSEFTAPLFNSTTPSTTVNTTPSDSTYNPDIVWGD